MRERDTEIGLIGYAVSLVILIGLMLVMILLLVYPVQAHEHKAGETTEQARVVEFYRTWKRPRGNFSIPHRQALCCYGGGDMQDCFPVEATRRNERGELEVMPDVSGASTYVQAQYGAKWYIANTGVDEDQQPDPRESPDGRSHVCIVGYSVVCYVPGYGN
jgi:hypothetical protein